MNTHGGIKTKPRINPWLVAGLTVILGLAVSVFTVLKPTLIYPFTLK